MSEQIPRIYKLAKIVPAFILKMVMRRLANTKEYGTQWWIKHNNEEKIKAYYGSLEAWKAIPDWAHQNWSQPADEEAAIHINHGYDESKPLQELSIEELQAAAAFRGGQLLSDSYSGNPAERLVWECHRGHRFQASPVLILEGGHWCPDCLPPPWEDEEMAAKSPFFRQIFR